jgi:hypothetical protein
MTNGEEQHRKIETTDGRDTTYGSDFAFRMNQIGETKWKRNNLFFGSLLGLVMGAVLFLLPDSLLAESARLVVVFVIAVLPMRFFEQRAERSIRYAKIGMAVCFIAFIIGYAVFLLVK